MGATPGGDHHLSYLRTGPVDGQIIAMLIPEDVSIPLYPRRESQKHPLLTPAGVQSGKLDTTIRPEILPSNSIVPRLYSHQSNESSILRPAKN